MKGLIHGCLTYLFYFFMALCLFIFFITDFTRRTLNTIFVENQNQPAPNTFVQNPVENLPDTYTDVHYAFPTINFAELHAACNFRELRDHVLLLVPPQHAGNFNIAQVCDVYEYLCPNWRYMHDPVSEEYLSPASRSWQLLAGDCDDQAICIATALFAIGGRTRIVLSKSNTLGNHSFAEVCLGKKNIEAIARYLQRRYKLGKGTQIHYRLDDNGNCWLSLDFTAKYPGGPIFRGDREWFYFLDTRQVKRI